MNLVGICLKQSEGVLGRGCTGRATKKKEKAMREKVILERFEANRKWVEILQNRITKLEQNEKIETSRPLTEEEKNNWNPQLTFQPAVHTDTHLLKDVVKLLLDRFGLELKKAPEKTKLQAKKGKKLELEH